MKKLLPIALLFVVMTFTSCLLDLITPQDTTPFESGVTYNIYGGPIIEGMATFTAK